MYNYKMHYHKTFISWFREENMKNQIGIGESCDSSFVSIRETLF